MDYINLVPKETKIDCGIIIKPFERNHAIEH